MSNKILIAVSSVIIVAIVIIAAALIFNTNFKSNPVQSNVPSNSISQTQSSKPVIIKAVMARGVDAHGNPVDETTVFNAKKDKVVYAVLRVSNIIKTTKLSYIRLINNKYIDSKVSIPTVDGITNFYFTFEKGIGNYPTGEYILKLYINGAYAQSLSYTFN